MVFTIVMFFISWGVPFLIIRALIRVYKKRGREEKELFDKVHDLNERKYELENQKYTAQKIVRCEYCGKLARFGDDTCPHCGAKLNTPEDV